MKTLRFAILLPDGTAITEKTRFGKLKKRIIDIATLRRTIYNLWKRESDSDSFQDWADAMNDDGDRNGHYTKDDAIDNMCNTFTLNIDNQYINLYDWWNETKMSVEYQESKYQLLKALYPNETEESLRYFIKRHWSKPWTDGENVETFKVWNKN